MTEVPVTNTRHRLSSDQVIRPYAAEDFPDFFEQSDTTVTVLSARRTFWEKATALHAEAHRPAESETPRYFSRHYYDLAMMLDSVEGKAATADLELMATVAKHKATFFRSGWANYDTARPSTLRLMPSEARINDLRADYRAMAPMMFDETRRHSTTFFPELRNSRRPSTGSRTTSENHGPPYLTRLPLPNAVGLCYRGFGRWHIVGRLD